MSVVTLVLGKSESYSRLDFPGSPEYFAANCTSACSLATLVLPSGLILKVPLTATSHTSAPSRSRTQDRSAANGVRLSNAHIMRDVLVDRHSGSLDPVYPFGPSQNVFTLDEHL